MRRRAAVISALAAAAGLSALAALMLGSASLSAGEVLFGLFSRGEGGVAASIIHAVRLPRCLAALLAGAGFGISGALLQSATANPLAGPNIIGVNAGAGFSMVLISCIFPLSYHLMPLAASVGAFGCTAIILVISARAGGSRVTTVLAGVAISALFGAGVSMLRLVFPDVSIEYSYFSIGGVGGVTLERLGAPAVIIAVCFALSMLLARRLNLFALGDRLAAGLGVRVKALRVLALLISSAAAAAAVSFAGLIGFVGLMTPHIARRLLGCEDMRLVLPASALCGGALVAAADTLGRTAFSPSEVPAGVFCALLGVPFFLFLLMRKGERI